MKILITRFDDPGDVLWTTPVVRCIKKQFPPASVHYLTNHGNEKLLKSNAYIEKLFLYHGDAHLTGELKEENYDLLIDLQNDRESREIRKKLEVKTFLVLETSWLGRILGNSSRRQHKAVRFMNTVSSVCRYDGKGLDFFIPASGMIAEKDIPASHQLGYIAFAIGGLSSTERISVKKIREFCQELDHPVILLGDQGSRLTGEEISSADAVKIYNASGKFNFIETTDLVKRCKVLISYDKGMIAMASALRKPVISIWTGNCPLADMQPFYPDAEVMKTPPHAVMKRFDKEVLMEKLGTILSKIQNSNSLTEG